MLLSQQGLCILLSVAGLLFGPTGLALPLEPHSDNGRHQRPIHEKLCIQVVRCGRSKAPGECWATVELSNPTRAHLKLIRQSWVAVASYNSQGNQIGRETREMIYISEAFRRSTETRYRTVVYFVPPAGAVTFRISLFRICQTKVHQLP